MEKPALTPMMEQYWSVKNQHQDCLLFFRMGDFYELFCEDALIAAPLLEITLTKRGRQGDDDIPMCGVPVGAYELYTARLLKKGHKVAICEQLESPEEAKKRGYKAIVKRDVIRIVTPGTLIEDTLLSRQNFNFLVSFSPVHKDFQAAAYTDISTGFFQIESFEAEQIGEVLERLNPQEILLPDSSHFREHEICPVWKKKITFLPLPKFDERNGQKRLLDTFQVKTFEAFGSLGGLETQAAGALIDYLSLTQKTALLHLSPPKLSKTSQFLVLDPSTRKNLEIHQTLQGDRDKSLLGVIDLTLTATGARLLNYRLSHPLLDPTRINQRLDKVDYYLRQTQDRLTLREILKEFPEVERSLARLSLQSGGPKDLGNMRQALLLAPKIQDLLCNEPLFKKHCDVLGSFEHLTLELCRTLNDQLPISKNEGGMIRSGFREDLDELQTLQKEAWQYLENLQKKYVQSTGIPNLKIRFNQIIGYHIEVSIGQKDKVPDFFVHRQTLSNHGRYTTPELLELAQKIESASQRILEIELACFQELVQKVLEHQNDLKKLSEIIADLDIASALAHLAAQKNYTRPIIDESFDLEIEGGRHPVVETLCGSSFTPNDCSLNSGQRFIVMTGPNMAGKSTYLRQNALIALMAQMGSFVPATKAKVGIVDRIFSRIGASDDLASGRSTFMVEMVETATILHQASPKSLVILDEIGRGTSTYDGLSIALAVSEQLYEKNQSRTLFATHYHELVQELSSYHLLAFQTMAIKEWEDRLIFLHQVIQGSADRSYGIHVASLAGFPKEVVQRAQEILESLEQPNGNAKVFHKVNPAEKVTQPSWLEAALKETDPSDLTPRQALDLLYAWKEKVAK